MDSLRFCPVRDASLFAMLYSWKTHDKGGSIHDIAPNPG